MTNEQFFLGLPSNFEKICDIYPPKVKDVVGNPQYNYFIKLLTLTQEEIEDEFVKDNLDMSALLTPLEYILNLAFNNAAMSKLIQEAFLFFIHEQIYFLFNEKKIIIGSIDSSVNNVNIKVLDEDNYFNFQNMVRQSINHPIVEIPNPNEDPRIKAIKAKARYRDRIKAKQGKGINLLTSLSSICCMGFDINPLNIGELSYAAVSVLMNTYQLKEKYQIDIDSLLAGADSKKIKPEYWIRNIKEDQ